MFKRLHDKDTVHVGNMSATFVFSSYFDCTSTFLFLFSSNIRREMCCSQVIVVFFCLHLLDHRFHLEPKRISVLLPDPCRAADR